MLNVHGNRTGMNELGRGDLSRTRSIKIFSLSRRDLMDSAIRESPSNTHSIDEVRNIYVDECDTNGLTLGELPPRSEMLKESEVFKLCDDWQPRYLVLTATELMISLRDSKQISDKIPLVCHRFITNRLRICTDLIYSTKSRTLLAFRSNQKIWQMSCSMKTPSAYTQLKRDTIAVASTHSELQAAKASTSGFRQVQNFLIKNFHPYMKYMQIIQCLLSLYTIHYPASPARGKRTV